MKLKSYFNLINILLIIFVLSLGLAFIIYFKILHISSSNKTYEKDSKLNSEAVKFDPLEVQLKNYLGKDYTIIKRGDINSDGLEEIVGILPYKSVYFKKMEKLGWQYPIEKLVVLRNKDKNFELLLFIDQSGIKNGKGEILWAENKARVGYAVRLKETEEVMTGGTIFIFEITPLTKDGERAGGIITIDWSQKDNVYYIKPPELVIFDLNEELKEKLDKKLSEISKFYKSVKTDPKFSVFADTINYILSNSFAFEFQGDKYVASFEWSLGGVHCCINTYIFRIDEDNQLILLEPSYIICSAPYECMPSKESLKIKNNKLYLEMTDTRFAYYSGVYADSPFFKRYILIEREKLVLANIDWKEEFIKEAEKFEKELNVLYKEVKKNQQKYLEEAEKYNWNIWTPSLVRVVVNYIVAREDEKAWKVFDEWFEKFSKLIPINQSKEEVKKDIIERMKRNPY